MLSPRGSLMTTFALLNVFFLITMWKGLKYKISTVPYPRENATFVTLCRNSDLSSLMGTIRGIEDRFNHNYHYDWVFLNNEPFDDEFKRITSALISGTARYGEIPEEHWSVPEWIDEEKAAEGRKILEDEDVIYGDSVPYRHMCRFESGFFFHHPIMQEYKYYWRVEPDTNIFCDISYDVFKFMREEKKRYGFVISLYEYELTIRSLWSSTLHFLQVFPQYVNPNNLAEFISEDGIYYNMCHFWSNFEIADADFWREEAYSNYFQFLDRMGGFFYERWGDAPVHSLAASLFLDKHEIHFFEDIGYYHPPYSHIPENFVDRSIKCSAKPDDLFDWDGYSCLRQYYYAQGLQLPPSMDPVLY